MSDLYHGEYPVDMTPTEARVALAELQAAKPYVPTPLEEIPPALLRRKIAQIIEEHHVTHVRQPSATNRPRRTFHQGTTAAVDAIMKLIERPSDG